MYSRFADGAEEFATFDCRWVLMVGEGYSPSIATFSTAMDALEFFQGCQRNHEAGRIDTDRTSYLPDIGLYYVPPPKAQIIAYHTDDEIPF